MLKWAHNPELRPANPIYVTQNSIDSIDVSDSVSLSDLSDIDRTINRTSKKKKKKAKRSLSMKTSGLLGISRFYDTGSSDWTPLKWFKHLFDYMTHRILFLRNGNRVKSLLSINEESREEEEVDPLIRGLIEYEQKMIRQLHQEQNDRPENTIADKFNVLWQGQGIPLHLVDNQWTLMGEKTLQTIEIVQSEVTQSFMVTADGVQDSILPDKYFDFFYKY